MRQGAGTLEADVLSRTLDAVDRAEDIVESFGYTTLLLKAHEAVVHLVEEFSCFATVIVENLSVYHSVSLSMALGLQRANR